MHPSHTLHGSTSRRLLTLPQTRSKQVSHRHALKRCRCAPPIFVLHNAYCPTRRHAKFRRTSIQQIGLSSENRAKMPCQSVFRTVVHRDWLRHTCVCKLLVALAASSNHSTTWRSRRFGTPCSLAEINCLHKRGFSNCRTLKTLSLCDVAPHLHCVLLDHAEELQGGAPKWHLPGACTLQRSFAVGEQQRLGTPSRQHQFVASPRMTCQLPLRLEAAQDLVCHHEHQRAFGSSLWHTSVHRYVTICHHVSEPDFQ